MERKGVRNLFLPYGRRPGLSGCRRKRFLTPFRGAIFILAALALVGVLVALSSTFLLTVAMRGRQAAYERHAVQATYAAEAGVEAALALLAEGHRPADAVTGDCGDGRFACTVHEQGRDLRLTSTGLVARPAGQAVYRRVVVTARREGPRVRVLQYTPKRCQEPFPPKKVPDTFSRDTEG